MKLSKFRGSLWATFIGASALLTALPAHAVVSFSNSASWALPPGSFGGAFDGNARLTFSNAGGNFLCSGSLLQGGEYVLTAAHCADDFTSMSVSFQNGAVTRTAAQAFVNSNWTSGAFGSGADVALIKLSAPVTTITGFELATGNALGNPFLLAGYGLVGTGVTGATGFAGTGAQFGYNQYDVLLNGPFGQTYLFDFDNGKAQQDTLCWVYGACGTGLGTNEADTAGGDSGGGSFVWNGSQWLLTGVHSFGFTFGQFVCPFNAALMCGDSDTTSFNSTFGEGSGDTAVISHLPWITSFLGQTTHVPEPRTVAIFLLGLACLAWQSRLRSR